MKTFRLWKLFLTLVSLGVANVALAQSVNLTLIYAFSGLSNYTNAEGANPESQLVFGPDGCLYGTTCQGGVNGNGTIFRVTTNGVLTPLGTFSNSDVFDRTASLALGPDGNLYGTAPNDGVNSNGGIFRVTTNGVISTIYSFSPLLNSTNADGGIPVAGLAAAHDGYFYGTTTEGGIYGQGTVFKIATNGNFTALGSFPVNGSYKNSAATPWALTFGPNGNLYGTTQLGGTNNDGTMFETTTNGVMTTLCSFGNPGGGSQPYAGLTPASDGNFYGTTFLGGSNNSGTVFKANPAGAIVTLVNFNITNGASPVTPLSVGADGDLYGVTLYGGTNNRYGGTIFRVTTNGAFASLFSFPGANSGLTNAEGSNPSSRLTLAPDGSFYGTTFQLGPNSSGTIFRLTILPPALGIQSVSRNIVLTWDDPAWSLQTATALNGLFTNVPSATSPYTNAVLPSAQFFRLIRN